MAPIFCLYDVNQQFFFAPILVMETSDNHPNKDLALMATSYWKTLKTKKQKKNLVEKSDLTLGTYLNMANSFLGCDQI